MAEPPLETVTLTVAQARAVECVHGTTRGCHAIRCGSNCSSNFDRMHPCPACLISEVADLRSAVEALGGNPYALPAPAPTVSPALRSLHD